MKSNQEVIDGEQVQVIRTEPMSLEHRVADIVDQTEQGLALFEERVRVAKRQLGIALQLAQPGQIMVYGDGDKQTVYLTAGASDRILRVGFGLRWGSKTVKVEKDSEGVTATATGDLIRADGSVYENFSGSRRMVFDANAPGGIKGYIKDEPNLIKSAIQNMKHTAVHDLLGVRFLSPADLLEIGVDLNKLPRHVEFQDHGPDDGSVPRVGFGKNKGKPITELGDKSLAWYLKAAQENVDDPSKAKWKEKNQAWLDACMEETARRQAPSQDGQPTDPDAMPAWDEREPGEDG